MMMVEGMMAVVVMLVVVMAVVVTAVAMMVVADVCGLQDQLFGHRPQVNDDDGDLDK